MEIYLVVVLDIMVWSFAHCVLKFSEDLTLSGPLFMFVVEVAVV